MRYSQENHEPDWSHTESEPPSLVTDVMLGTSTFEHAKFYLQPQHGSN